VQVCELPGIGIVLQSGSDEPRMPRHGPQAGALVSTGGMVETLRLAAVEPILGGEQVEFVTGAMVEAHSSLPVTPAELRASAWKMGFQRYYDAGL
jgi:hypothetical protein